MPKFPALSPGSRVFSPGEYPQAAYKSIDGRRTNVAHSTTMISCRLELGFTALSETELGQIFQHYNGQLGSFQSFQVQTDVFAGFPDITVGTGSGASFPNDRWRYSGPPRVEEVPTDPTGGVVYNVSVALETAPAQGASVAGAAFSIRYTLTAGAATASSAATGAGLTVTLSLQAGAATGD